jgi:chemotaxis protein MotB
MTNSNVVDGASAWDQERRPSYFELLAKPDWSNAAGQAWLLTFTDLVALMLAFFVLLFAMSQVEQRKWDGLVGSLASDLSALQSSETTKPAVEYHPKEDAVVPGAALDYLTPVIRQQVATHPLLARAAIHRSAERLVISLPAGLLYRPGAVALAPQARDIGSALGSVLRNLNNRIAIEAHLARPGAAPAGWRDWDLALARAAAFAGILTRSGYRGPIVAHGMVGSGLNLDAPIEGVPIQDAPIQDAPIQDDGRLDVVIHELAQEPR